MFYLIRANGGFPAVRLCKKHGRESGVIRIFFQSKKDKKMPNYIFQEVKLYGSKSGKCSVCGKACTRSQKFSQTLNPFNKNKKGEVKTWQEIKAELSSELTEWRSKPPIHSRCA